MLTKLIIKNFKRFERVEVELGNPVVFVGPNNSGKTTALQALALWETGLKRWNEKKGEKTPGKRSGVTINRRDLVALPVPNAKLLWQNLHVRGSGQVNGKPGTTNVRIDIIVEGVTKSEQWKCGLEFDYANPESFYCRPLRLLDEEESDRMTIPEPAGEVQLAFLPPMSGLASNETRLDPGAIDVRIGEGRTAEVLRNLCFNIYDKDKNLWEKLRKQIDKDFGVSLDDPRYIQERGEVEMSYKEGGILLDLSAAGKGLQQTLLLLSYMYSNPGAVLLLDEPDAHLEILRQRQIYRLLNDGARENENQIIIASHSEVVLNEAADKEVVVAFVGKPHRLNDRRGSQVLKSLREIGWDQYYQAEQKGWALYLEGSTDLAILQTFAETLNHEARKVLKRSFVHYVGNKPSQAKNHFHGLKEAIPDLKGIAIFDRLDQELQSHSDLQLFMWKRREIENYLCSVETLEAYAENTILGETTGPLFAASESKRRKEAMSSAIKEVEQALKTLKKGSPWDTNTKVSDDFLEPLFERYFQESGLPNLMRKTNFHELARFVPAEKIDPEIKDKLDAIVKTHEAQVPPLPIFE
ncbi:MAG: ATP-dependent endonuclease [Nitrospinales bacterium]